MEIDDETEIKRYYYAFSFSYDNKMASVYIGYPEPLVSIPRIENAKKDANMPSDSVLIGLGYMGRMSDFEVDNLK